LKTSRVLLQALLGAGVVEHHRSDRGPACLEVSSSLQDDFSLHHTLSLFVLETLGQLDPTLESHALDVVTLAESVLENPTPVLHAQLDKLKREKIAELKARGAEYAERVDEMDKLEWPKPLADFIYAHYNDFARRHPWVGEENIRPKSVVREMLERFSAFDDYVREYGVQRSEGVLLRYLSQGYRLLLQTIPEVARTDELEDLIASLGTLVRGVDSSLLDEWEGLASPEGAPAPLPAPPRSSTPDPKTFAARVRSELHALVRALAAQSWEAARACIVDPSDEWTEEKLAAEMRGFFQEHSAIRLTPDTRRAEHTLLRQEGPQRWSARQRLFDADGEDDWFVECEIDLERPRKEGLPLIALRRVGS
jgi:hypothetical protein